LKALFFGGVYWWSRHLRMEIEDLEQQADKLEHQLRQSQPVLAAT
jgi:hypothetical protein